MVLSKFEELAAQYDGIRSDALRARVECQAAWLSLGRLLTEIAYGGDYREWGYPDFVVYCETELGIAKARAKKLMIGYQYVKERAPERLDESDCQMHHVPECQTIELLRRVETADAGTDIAEYHAKAFSGAVDENELRKELRDVLRQPDLMDKGGKTDAKLKAKAEFFRSIKAARRAAVEAGFPEIINELIESAVVQAESVE